jgi:hypothetical protein
MSNRAKATQVVNAEWVWQEAKKLRMHMDTVDTYRMSHSALHDYVMLLLSDGHMAILTQSTEEVMLQLTVQEILMATRHLKYEYMQPISNRLALLVPRDSVMLSVIYKQQHRSYRHALWEKYLPLVIISITLLLCMFMYLYNRH